MVALHCNLALLRLSVFYSGTLLMRIGIQPVLMHSPVFLPCDSAGVSKLLHVCSLQSCDGSFIIETQSGDTGKTFSLVLAVMHTAGLS